MSSSAQRGDDDPQKDKQERPQKRLKTTNIMKTPQKGSFDAQQNQRRIQQAMRAVRQYDARHGFPSSQRRQQEAVGAVAGGGLPARTAPLPASPQASAPLIPYVYQRRPPPADIFAHMRQRWSGAVTNRQVSEGTGRTRGYLLGAVGAPTA